MGALFGRRILHGGRINVWAGKTVLNHCPMIWLNLKMSFMVGKDGGAACQAEEAGKPRRGLQRFLCIEL